MPMFRQSKRNSRIDRDMISGPLGDFRHTMHIGRGGDVFGDTSFLSKPGAPPDRPAAGPPLPSPVASFAAGPDTWSAQTADAKAKPSSPDSGSSDASVSGTYGEMSFDSRGRGGIAASLPAASARANGKPADDGRVANGHGKPERSSGSDIESYDNYSGDVLSSSPGGSSSDPGMAFDLDLGPSMLDDILSIMDMKGSYGTLAAAASPPERRNPAPRKTWEFDDDDGGGGEAAAVCGRDDGSASRAKTGDGYGAPAPRNWNHDSGVVYEAASPRRDDVYGGGAAAAATTAAAAAPYVSPSHTVRSAGSHASSGSSAESGVACEDGRRKFSSGSFDKLSDDEPGESYTFDDDDDEIRV